MSTFRELCGRFWLLIMLTVAPACKAMAQENVNADGILVRDRSLVLFTHVLTCSAEPKLPVAQIFVSLDGGKTWSKRGPQLEGSVFEYILDVKTKLWIAGSHIAEGPAIDPFVMVSTNQLSDWKFHRIYEGPAELRNIAIQKNGQLIAWISHINPHQEHWEGPTYIHKSSDDGLTWKIHGRLPKDAGTPEGQLFQRIEKQDAAWRTADLDEGGFEVQHQQEDHTWMPVSRFSLQMCRPTGVPVLRKNLVRATADNSRFWRR